MYVTTSHDWAACLSNSGKSIRSFTDVMVDNWLTTTTKNVQFWAYSPKTTKNNPKSEEKHDNKSMKEKGLTSILYLETFSVDGKTAVLRIQMQFSQTMPWK